MKVVVLNKQSVFDLAIRYCGTIEASFDIAVLNELSITDDLVPGTELEIPIEDYGSKDIARYFEMKGHQPATAMTEIESETLTPNEGISFWAIATEFIIS